MFCDTKRYPQKVTTFATTSKPANKHSSCAGLFEPALDIMAEKTKLDERGVNCLRAALRMKERLVWFAHCEASQRELIECSIIAMLHMQFLTGWYNAKGKTVNKWGLPLLLK